jgi:hypothetical protein
MPALATPKSLFFVRVDAKGGRGNSFSFVKRGNRTYPRHRDQAEQARVVVPPLPDIALARDERSGACADIPAAAPDLRPMGSIPLLFLSKRTLASSMLHVEIEAR